MVEIQSGEGHDGFLVEFEQMNTHITKFIAKYSLGQEIDIREIKSKIILKQDNQKESLFGEQENIDICEW